MVYYVNYMHEISFHIIAYNIAYCLLPTGCSFHPPSALQQHPREELPEQACLQLHLRPHTAANFDGAAAQLCLR